MIFRNFVQENYDSLKIFLISKYNVRFLSGQNEETRELLEINDNDTIIAINFYKNDSIEIISNDEHNNAYKTIIKKIQQIAPESIESNDNHSGDNVESRQNNDTHYIPPDDLFKFFEHISTCDPCKEKFASMWKHYKTK